ncbi:hypothetical protein AGMMS49982_13060 [Bacteroidia bacterium]|nr:hypothetical protein AGMMS49982_13060 [Bacteroidia bacterium]
MAKNGKNLINETPRLGNKTLVTEDKDIRRKELSFSFLHFRQIKNFEIGDCPSKWHISLLERLSILTPDILENNKGSNALRCHPIDWSCRNIPIQRTDLNWLPNEILINDGDFPMMQISLSTGTGRIVGYFDKNFSVFYIVLLDPKHNLQPSIKTNYQIQPTTIGISQYDDLLSKFENISKLAKKCPHKQVCQISPHIEHTRDEHNLVYVSLDAAFFKEYHKLLEEYSLQEIVEHGIVTLMK